MGEDVWKVDDDPETSGGDGPLQTIFFGGPILTIGDDLPEVEALAIKDGRIIALGDRQEVFQFHSASTRMVDLRGRALMPGFVDPHVNIALSAFIGFHWMDLSRQTISSREQLISMVGTAATRMRAGEWVLAFGYSPPYSSRDQAAVTPEELDHASTTHPILIIEQSSEQTYVNHKALQALGLNSAESLSGKDLAAVTLASFFGRFPRITFEENLDDCRRLLQSWAKKGCTTVYDAAVGALSGQEEIRLLLELASDPSTPLRIRAALVPSNDLPKIAGIRPRQGNNRLSFLGITLAADGLDGDVTLAEAVGARIEGGRFACDDDELTIRMRSWHDSNWQLLFDTGSSEAVDQVLRVFGAVLKQSPNAGHRHRIDRCTIIDRQQLILAKQLGLSISHLISKVSCPTMPTNQSPGGQCNFVPLAAEFEQEIKVSLQSDSPITPVNPLQHLQAAVTRSLIGCEDSVDSDQRIGIDEALKTITIYPAYQCFLDHAIGSLEVGKIADLVVLDCNPRQVDPNRIAEIEVLETYVDGVPQMRS